VFGIPELDDPRIMAWSPALHVPAIPPPILIVHGRSDRLVPIGQSRALKDAYERAHAYVEYVEVVGAGHAFRATAPAMQPSREEITVLVVNFFERFLASDRAEGRVCVESQQIIEHCRTEMRDVRDPDRPGVQ